MPSSRSIQQTDRLLELLHDAGVKFVVIGGVAAISHGASTATRDLDIAAPLTAENVGRLMAALRPYRPTHVTRPDLGEIRESIERLCEFRLLPIDTDLGRLDVLREVEPLGPAESLATEVLELLPGKHFQVLSLEQLIAVKAHLRRPKDRIVEMELRAIRERRG